MSTPGGRRGGPVSRLPPRDHALRTSPPPGGPPAAEVRFRTLDRYRVDREWSRYEGNALRDLFRQLRLRFLRRHPADRSGRVIEVGPGPGRFSPAIGDADHPLVLLDLALVALQEARRHLGDPRRTATRPTEYVRGNARRPPVRPGAFAQAVLFGNSLGFAGERSAELLRSVAGLVAPGGSLLIECAPSTGERSNYLARLPAGALRRLFAAPPVLLERRIVPEGFSPIARPARPSKGFHREPVRATIETVRRLGFAVEETMVVAPGLGFDAERLSEVRREPRAWSHLLEVEERLGRSPDRWAGAAAVLLAFRRTPDPVGPPVGSIK